MLLRSVVEISVRDGIVLFHGGNVNDAHGETIVTATVRDVDIDARVARTRTAVIRAATDLLVEGGPSAVTIDAIVARSGVAKSTIYRHWESRDDVLVDVLHACAPDIETPPAELGFERGLRALGRELVRILNDPEWTRIIPALFMLKAHADGCRPARAGPREASGDGDRARAPTGCRRGSPAPRLRPRGSVRIDRRTAAVRPPHRQTTRSTTPSPIAPSTSSSTRTEADPLVDGSASRRRPCDRDGEARRGSPRRRRSSSSRSTEVAALANDSSAIALVGMTWMWQWGTS